MLRHDCISGLPAASIWLYCSIAFDAACVPFPPARNISLRARPRLVAFTVPVFRFPSVAVSFCTSPTIPFKVVGRPSNLSDIVDTELEASSTEKPSEDITFGKLASVSTRAIAPEMFDVIAEVILLVMLATTPPIAPAETAEKPERKDFPPSVPPDSDAETNSRLILLDTPVSEGLICIHAVPKEDATLLPFNAINRICRKRGVIFLYSLYHKIDV